MRKLFGIILALLVMSGTSLGKIDRTGLNTIYVHNTITYSDAYELDKALGDIVSYIIDTNQKRELHIKITSPGGSADGVVGAVEFIDELKQQGWKIYTYTYGMAASAGFMLFMTGDERYVHPDDTLMMHSVVFVDWRGAVVPDNNLTPEQKRQKIRLNNFSRRLMKKAGLRDSVMDSLLQDKALYFDGNDAYAWGIATHMIKSL